MKHVLLNINEFPSLEIARLRIAFQRGQGFIPYGYYTSAEKPPLAEQLGIECKNVADIVIEKMAVKCVFINVNDLDGNLAETVLEIERLRAQGFIPFGFYTSIDQPPLAEKLAIQCYRIADTKALDDLTQISLKDIRSCLRAAGIACEEESDVLYALMRSGIKCQQVKDKLASEPVQDPMTIMTGLSGYVIHKVKNEWQRIKFSFDTVLDKKDIDTLDIEYPEDYQKEIVKRKIMRATPGTYFTNGDKSLNPKNNNVLSELEVGYSPGGYFNISTLTVEAGGSCLEEALKPAGRAKKMSMAKPSFWQRNKHLLIGILVGLVITAVVTTLLNVFVFPLLVALAIGVASGVVTGGFSGYILKPNSASPPQGDSKGSSTPLPKASNNGSYRQMNQKGMSVSPPVNIDPTPSIPSFPQDREIPPIEDCVAPQQSISLVR